MGVPVGFERFDNPSTRPVSLLPQW